MHFKSCIPILNFITELDKEEELSEKTCKNTTEYGVGIFASPPKKIITPWQLFLKEYGESDGEIGTIIYIWMFQLTVLYTQVVKKPWQVK